MGQGRTGKLDGVAFDCEVSRSLSFENPDLKDGILISYTPSVPTVEGSVSLFCDFVCVQT